MKNSRGFIFALFSALTAALIVAPGCAFKKDTAPKKMQAAGPTAEDVANELERQKQERLKAEMISIDDFAFDIIEGEQANDYFISVTYPIVPGVKVFVAPDTVPLESSESGVSFPVNGGALVSLYLTAQNSSGQTILNSVKKIQVPLDFVISRIHNLNNDLNLKLGRLYLENNSVLKTNGFRVSIEAERISAGANSKIINFHPHEVWSDTRSHSGGSISIRSKEASGFLIINLQGAKGRNGRSGSELESINNFSPRMNDGYDGDDADYDYDYQCDERYERPSCGFVYKKCRVPPTNGEDGENGPAGYAGENGFPGGDTGNLFMQIEDHSNFTLRLSLKVGSPGIGGLGAQGHPGSKGGKAGALDPEKVCKPANNGKDGIKGPQGRNGDMGAAGKVGTIELNGLKNAIIE